MRSVEAARRRDLLWMLTRTEFRLREQGTVAGFLWALLHPLLLFAVLYAVFSGQTEGRVESYPAYLLIGVVQWGFFSAATSAGLTSLRRKAGLLAGHAVPKVYVVAASVGAVFLSHLLEWAVLLLVLPGLGVYPSAGWLSLPALLAAEAALALALSLPLASAAVFVRDLDRVWSLGLYAAFFATPVFYLAADVGPWGRLLVAANPLAILLEATRSCLLGAAATPSPSAAVCGAAALALASVLWAVYPRLSRGVVERL